jgi:superfamily II DNA or RNA helicase
MQTSLQLSPSSTSTAPALRPYQLEAIAAIRAQLAQGRRRLLVALPTGTGKTIVFAALPQALALPGRWLVLAHREELLDQAAAKLEASNPSLSVAVEQAGRRANGAGVVVASVPTLQRARLEALQPQDFAGVICDEAHHSVATSYRAIFDHFGLLEPGCPRPLLGFTATPTRGDQIGLSAVYEAIAYEATLRKMIGAGFLVPICGQRIETSCDLSEVKVRGGEFVTSELAEAVDTDERNGLIVKAYRDHAAGRRAIAFCADVEHATNLAQAFTAAGLRADSVSGLTPQDERHSKLRRFHAGELDVLSNCNVLTEGFDEPQVDCILMARPTKSSLLYTQMVGRGTRLAPGKSDLLVLDFADNSARHSLLSTASLFGLPPNLALAGKDVLQVAKQVEAAQRTMPWLDLSTLKHVDELKYVASRIDFFNSKPPSEILRFTKFCWLPAADGAYRLPLPEKELIEVLPTRLDTWQIRWTTRTGIKTQGERGTLQEALALADAMVPMEASVLVDSRASWRRTPASEKQIGLLKKLGVEVPSKISKGQASAILSMKLDAKRSRGGRW